METCINTACNDFHVESDTEEIWEGGCINGAGSKDGWSELSCVRRLGDAKVSGQFEMFLHSPLLHQ